jgi:hypothetical protein
MPRARRDGRTFTEWFLERELKPESGMGTAPERAEMHLCRALTYLDRGMVREALDEANAAAHLDLDLRPRALLIARLCVRKELEDLGLVARAA